LKRLVQYIADKLGFVVVGKWGVSSYLLESRIKRIIAEYDIDCIFDVGANVGQYHDFLRKKVGFKGTIVSFEPDPNNCEELREKKLHDKKWVIQEFALGREDTVLQLNIMSNSAFNSFLEPNNIETSLFQNANTVENVVSVKVKRLSDIFFELKEKYNFNNVFLKLDTQGFDLDVFDGASECLDQIKGVQTEVSVLPIYKNMPSIETSLELFKSKGFEVSGLYSLSETRFPHAIEFDCIYLPK